MQKSSVEIVGASQSSKKKANPTNKSAELTFK
jgi:hypothetical protein